MLSVSEQWLSCWLWWFFFSCQRQCHWCRPFAVHLVVIIYIPFVHYYNMSLMSVSFLESFRRCLASLPRPLWSSYFRLRKNKAVRGTLFKDNCVFFPLGKLYELPFNLFYHFSSSRCIWFIQLFTNLLIFLPLATIIMSFLLMTFHVLLRCICSVPNQCIFDISNIWF